MEDIEFHRIGEDVLWDLAEAMGYNTAGQLPSIEQMTSRAKQLRQKESIVRNDPYDIVKVINEIGLVLGIKKTAFTVDDIIKEIYKLREDRTISVTSNTDQIVVEGAEPEIAYFSIQGPTWPNDAARRILEQILPEWVEYFLKKSADYGDHHGELGLRGEFVGIWRKIWKLRRGLWEGESMNHEGPEEMLDDLIGSAFLAKDTIRNK